jgi:hypothetical protein
MGFKVETASVGRRQLLTIFDCVYENFGEYFAGKLLKRVHQFEVDVSRSPFMYAADTHLQNYRKAVLHRNLICDYRVDEAQHEVLIVGFRDAR